jgi:hypothetical protein
VDELFALPETGRPRAVRLTGPAGSGAFDRSFPVRVAALLRSRPISDLATNAPRHGLPPDTYDVATLALAAIDIVIAQQGFDDEATYEQVVEQLQTLAAKAAPHRPGEEHGRVARYTVNGLLNRSGREVPFTYRISDYSSAPGHSQRQVQFRLLVEREDPARDEVILNATGDAINALVGGLEFEVEDEQVANETLLERQLARGAFDAAERAAVRARLLSVSLTDQLQTLLRQTRRDLHSVLADWTTDVPQTLDQARDHIRARVDAEHRLLTKVRESVSSEDDAVSVASARIVALLDESRRRHELLHGQVIDARAVFLEEQDRQSFRPPVRGYLPDLGREVLDPLLHLDTATAAEVTAGWLADLGGPRPPRVPRLYRVIDDWWTQPDAAEVAGDPLADEEDVVEVEEPVIRPSAVAAAARAVQQVGLPARLSALIAACLHDPATPEPADRRQAAELTGLAALWCFSAEDGEDGSRSDLATRVFGDRAAVDADDVRLRLPGWSGDDLIVAPHQDALATADPVPVTAC